MESCGAEDGTEMRVVAGTTAAAAVANAGESIMHMGEAEASHGARKVGRKGGGCSAASTTVGG